MATRPSRRCSCRGARPSSGTRTAALSCSSRRSSHDRRAVGGRSARIGPPARARPRPALARRRVAHRPGSRALGRHVGGDGPDRHLVGAHRRDPSSRSTGWIPAARRFADRFLVYTLLGAAAEEVLIPRVGRLDDPPEYPIPAARNCGCDDAAPVRPGGPSTARRGPRADRPAHRTTRRRPAGVPLVGSATANATWRGPGPSAHRLALEHAAVLQAWTSALLVHDELDGAAVVEIFDAAERSA